MTETEPDCSPCASPSLRPVHHHGGAAAAVVETSIKRDEDSRNFSLLNKHNTSAGCLFWMFF